MFRFNEYIEKKRLDEEQQERDILKEKNNMTEEEAIEYLEFNTIGAWVGEKTPMFVSLTTMEEIDEM